jgi:hypothetical protein
MRVLLAPSIAPRLNRVHRSEPSLPLDLLAPVVAAQPPGHLDIDTTVRGAWWTNPVWIAVGIIGLVSLIAFVAAVLRRRLASGKD